MSTHSKPFFSGSDQDNLIVVVLSLVGLSIISKYLLAISIGLVTGILLNTSLRGKSGNYRRFLFFVVVLAILGVVSRDPRILASLPIALIFQWLIGRISNPETNLNVHLDRMLNKLFTLPVLNSLDLAKETKTSDEGIHLGSLRDSNRELVINDKALGHHIYILGASGFGKSVTLQKIIKDRIEKDQGLMYLDLKSDAEVLSDIQNWCANSNRLDDLQIFDTNDIENSIHYNPLKNGNYTEIKDLIMGSLEWSEPFYKNTCEDFLLRILEPLTVLRDLGEFVLDLPTLIDCLTLPNLLIELAGRLPMSRVDLKQDLGEAAKFIKNKENFKLLSNLQVQLRSVTKTNFGSLLSSDVLEIDLFSAANSSKIVVFMLDSRRFGKSVKSLGKIILQDLKAVSSRIGSEIKEDERRLFTPIIDEFSDLATPEFLSFLDRARSSKMGTVICHQEMMDLNDLGSHFAKRLVNLTSTQLIFNSKNPETCDYFASIIGTETVTKETERSKNAFILGNQKTGDRSLREAESFRVHPNTFRSLEIGQCVWITKYPKSDFGLCIVSNNT